MTFEKHCEESIRLFGKPYEEVHRWLDEFAGSKKYGMRHRKVRYLRFNIIIKKRKLIASLNKVKKMNREEYDLFA